MQHYGYNRQLYTDIYVYTTQADPRQFSYESHYTPYRRNARRRNQAGTR